jgi:hypothetical protein
MAKLQYMESSELRTPGSAAAFSTHPDIEERIERVRTSKIARYDRGTRFDGLNDRGETVCTLTLNAWSTSPLPKSALASVPDPSLLNSRHQFESRIYATLECSSELPNTAVRGVSLIGNRGSPLWLDNYEDTSVGPDDVLAMSFFAYDIGEDSLTGIQAIQVEINGVASWVRRTAPQ